MRLPSLNLRVLLTCCATLLLVNSAALAQGSYLWANQAGTIGGAGFADGRGLSAGLSGPSGVAVDASGNTYVADTDNHTIRKVTSAGVVTTLAGVAGKSGSMDGPAVVARFLRPRALAVDTAGNVYVADGNHTIRKVAPDGTVRTLAGSAANPGLADGFGPAARFDDPAGVAVDAAGTVYVTDSYYGSLRRISPAGSVSTLVSGNYPYGGGSRKFAKPTGVAVDPNGEIYVADELWNVIWKVTQTGVVTLLAGEPGDSSNPPSAGSVDGIGRAARFNRPTGIAYSGGFLFVADQGNRTIRVVDSGGGKVTTVAGSPLNAGNADGTGSAARFSAPAGVAALGLWDIVVADQGNHTLRRVSGGVVQKVPRPGVVTTFAGHPRLAGTTDDTGSLARFNQPFAVAVDANGTAYVADRPNHTIRKVTATGVTTTLAGAPGLPGSADGTGSDARFNNPCGVALDTAGNLFVADRDNHTIRRVSVAGEVTTVAGSSGTPGATDGNGSEARFRFPEGVAIDANGNLFVADTSNHLIRKITSDGVVSRLAGVPVQPMYPDTGIFNYPSGIAVGPTGLIYVADTQSCCIRRVTSAGAVSNYAGTAYTFPGSTDGPVTYALLNYPKGIAVDALGNVFISDTGNNTIRKISVAGIVSTVGGGQPGNAGGVGSAARFDAPTGIAVSPAGQLYVAGGSNPNLVIGTPVPDITVRQGSNSFVSGGNRTDWGTLPLETAGTARTFRVTNDGAAPLTGLSLRLVSLQPAPAPEFTVTAPLSATSLDPGQSATFSVNFTPSRVGGREYTLYLDSNDPDEPAFYMAIAGTGQNGTPPVLASVSFVSNNPSPRWARPGDKMTLSFTSEVMLETPVVTIQGQAVAAAGSGTSWQAELVATAAMPQQQYVTFSITARDSVGNTVTQTTTTDNTFIKIDTVKPALTASGNLTLETTGAYGMNVDYPLATATDASGPVDITYSKVSGSFFPLGSTKVTVTATDFANNVTGTSFNVLVQDTTKPVITGVFAPRVLLFGQPLPDYLAMATIRDLGVLKNAQQVPAAGTLLAEGVQTVTISVSDLSGNAATTSFTIEVRPTEAASDALVSSGGRAPGAGGASGVPFDATLATIGDPAIDDGPGTVVVPLGTTLGTLHDSADDPIVETKGRVVFSATWRSAKYGAGTGIFTRTSCLAATGRLGKFTSVGTPVIDRGNIAFLAAIKSAPVVMGPSPGGALGTVGVVASRGGSASDTGFAIFNTFTQVGLAGESVAFVAHLKPGSGTPRTTAYTDTGIWAKDATHPLKLMLREGQPIGAKKIKTLTAFHGGNGSPGQGRGWVLNDHGVTKVHALAVLTDNTQAQLVADIEGHVTVLSSTGLLGTGKPTLAGATFASYSFPALNELGDHAFLGTMTVGPGGVKAVDNRGIFLNDPATGTYDLVARLGGQAAGVEGVTAATGATHSLFWDPVLQSDGGVAFRSLLTGVKPGNNDTLWWQPAGASLKLLAQEGQQPAGSSVASEKWVAFTSLAIAPNRGPIFTATVSGGGSGLWATDYTGQLRMLFRTGDFVEGKPLASFSVLKALPGAMGMSRSFNGTGRVIWLATFKDRSTAIVQTTVP